MRTIAEFEAAARGRLDPVHYDYFAGGAQDEITLRENETAFQDLRLVPRVLRGSDKRDLSIELLGTPSSMPILVAPTAFHRLAHSDGELATARAAARAGTIMIVSMAATTAVEDIAAAAREVAPDPALWFQLYLQPDLEFTEAIVRRAEAAGVKAFVVTVDSPVLGRRERDDRNAFHDLPPGLVVENLRNLGENRSGGNASHVREIVMSAGLSWDHIAWLRSKTKLPVLIKGVLHAEDARLAVHHGVAGIVVSNHGGRQLDTVPATIEVLPEIAAAVGGAIPVLLDGGIRRGTDVVKALALGADAVGVGRPIVWGLAAGGREGVSEVLDLLRDDFDQALALCGGRHPADLTPDQVRR
ncbi:(S)-2-hydroxy-acid oxidase [Amycolatopsis mediterranei S699]|uniref:(S)-2-hydroxy-acid oxidase n=2 Tax=Amycolatopsis mediterranei TaxID=33910 RepID=A0A0H3CVP6_AMYMU|nr:alpha-hydroxy acid oxidase [Amycolatopsis mediterranei]ADJ42712.1 (S)-2-hydroxy-acid oxidase [Amycolatopsis mediterranei U32]AEK39403.1 (S)-2-hydroxy-acid oxidase [Amycolatopsis mediterranei S699]AFO74426.1 (S)-2-hydroxy-acid oxidase [Amycolatopsis mediterranei S699]AGT81555.1 (S)-2-hydroxy-acid oxidase [Amycolatopsis mediterranei RB]KDO09988.1 2-hydroxy-acid oxidase [Amycolatopsis mediterranei]